MHSFIQPYVIENIILNYLVLFNKPSHRHILLQDDKKKKKIFKIKKLISILFLSNGNKLNTPFLMSMLYYNFLSARKKSILKIVLKCQAFIYILNVQNRKVPS